MNHNNKNEDNIKEIFLSEIHSFNNHPFKVKDDVAMMELSKSIKLNGVLLPGVVRTKKEGGYELISGHRRKRACELAGKNSMPVFVKELNDDEAVLTMVDSNLHRDTLLFSEKAFSYKMKTEILKRKVGRHSKDEFYEAGTKSCEIICKQVGESKNQIFRYIRLTELIDELLEMVDKKIISFNPAVEISYLRKEEQQLLLNEIIKEEATPSLSQVLLMKKYSHEGSLNERLIHSIMINKKQEVFKITFTKEKYLKYFPNTVTPRQIEDTIIKLLENWSKSNSQNNKEGGYIGSS